MTSRQDDTRIANQLWAEYARTHDPRTRDAIVLQFQRLAFSIANRFSKRGLDNEDLVQVAMIGLVKAVDRFDPTTQHRFSTFATPTILGELKRHFRDHGWNVHVPRGMQELALQVDRTRREMTERLGRQPSAAELAARLEVSEERIQRVLGLEETQHLLSLDGVMAAADSDRATSLEQCLGDEDPRMGETECRVSVRQALHRLPESLRYVIEQRYLFEKSQREVARGMGLSQMQVARLERRALQQLRLQFAVH